MLLCHYYVSRYTHCKLSGLTPSRKPSSTSMDTTDRYGIWEESYGHSQAILKAHP